MKAIDFKGIIPPLITPYTEDGEIYEEGLKNLIEFTIPHVQGYYPVGTYGSGPFMSNEDRKKCAELIIKHVNGRVPVIIHVGAVDTASTVELAKHAESAGAAAVGAIAPYYQKHTDEEIFQHFKALVEAVSIPVFVYNNPSISGNVISPGVAKRLAELGLRGIKDSSFDLVSFSNYKKALAEYDDFNVVIGTEAILVGAFANGAQAAVTGVSNVYPELIQQLYQEAAAGDYEKARETQLKALKVREITKYGATVPTMMAILKLRGVDAGYPKKPLLPVTQDVIDRVEKALKDLDLL